MSLIFLGLALSSTVDVFTLDDARERSKLQKLREKSKLTLMVKFEQHVDE